MQQRLKLFFVAAEENPFHKAYGDAPPEYAEYLRSYYEYFWPSEYSSGSGFLISAEGHIVTCDHCVQTATKTLVVVHEDNFSRLYQASKIGGDPLADVAVLKIEPREGLLFPYLKFGDSNCVQLGESVMAIGNPHSEKLAASITVGIVSGKNRKVFPPYFESYIQTDASLNPGNSGGPLLNCKGEVIGVANSASSYYQGICFATPSNLASLIANQLISTGKILRSFLGVELGEEMVSAFDVYDFDLNQGAVVKRVIPDSPACLAGILDGDRIAHLDDMPVPSAFFLQNQIASLPPEKKISLTVNRQGSLISFAVELSGQELWNAYVGYADSLL